MMKVAILGATSHIAKNLIYQNNLKPKWDLYLFARNLGKLEEFLNRNPSVGIENSFHLDKFLTNRLQFDAVINCVGFGTQRKVKNAGIDLFLLTESIDYQVMMYLKIKPSTVYVNFSSGAVYGTFIEKPIGIGHKSVIDMLPL